MTHADLQQIIDAAGKATPGPWALEDGRIIRAEDQHAFHSNGFERNSLGISSASYSSAVAGLLPTQDQALPQPAANIAYLASLPPEVGAALARIALAAVEYWSTTIHPATLDAESSALHDALRDAGLIE